MERKALTKWTVETRRRAAVAPPMTKSPAAVDHVHLQRPQSDETPRSRTGHGLVRIAPATAKNDASAKRKTTAAAVGTGEMRDAGLRYAALSEDAEGEAEVVTTDITPHHGPGRPLDLGPAPQPEVRRKRKVRRRVA